MLMRHATRRIKPNPRGRSNIGASPPRPKAKDRGDSLDFAHVRSSPI